MDDILKKITDTYLLFQIERVGSFHGYLSTGAFIGIQMLNIAKRVLDADPGEQLYVTCETYNCLLTRSRSLPDARSGIKN